MALDLELVFSYWFLERPGRLCMGLAEYSPTPLNRPSNNRNSTLTNLQIIFSFFSLPDSDIMFEQNITYFGKSTHLCLDNSQLLHRHQQYNCNLSQFVLLVTSCLIAIDNKIKWSSKPEGVIFNDDCMCFRHC